MLESTQDERLRNSHFPVGVVGSDQNSNIVIQENNYYRPIHRKFPACISKIMG